MNVTTKYRSPAKVQYVLQQIVLDKWLPVLGADRKAIKLIAEYNRLNTLNLGLKPEYRWIYSN